MKLPRIGDLALLVAALADNYIPITVSQSYYCWDPSGMITLQSDMRTECP